jgi:hypothetical protein
MVQEVEAQEADTAAKDGAVLRWRSPSGFVLGASFLGSVLAASVVGHLPPLSFIHAALSKVMAITFG